MKAAYPRNHIRGNVSKQFARSLRSGTPTRGVAGGIVASVKSNPSSGILQLTALAFFFAFGLNALGIYYVSLLIAALLLLLNNGNRLGSIPIDANFIMLTLFAITYSLFAYAGPRQVAIVFLFPVGYLAGLLFVRTGPDFAARFRRLVLALALGMATHGVLNAVTNLRVYGLSPDSRVLPDYWSNSGLTGTLQATLFVPLVGIAYYSFFVRQRYRAALASAIALGLVFATIYNLATASRTIFLVAPVAIAASCLTMLWLAPRSRAALLSLGLLGGLLVGYLANSWGISPLQSLFARSALTARLAQPETTTLNEDPRFSRWDYALDHFFDDISGGLHMRAKVGYIHNLWLDAYDTAGLLPFLALLVFTVSSLMLVLAIVRSGQIPVGIKVLVAGFWAACLAQFMTEPIFDGVPELFALFCTVCGASRALRDGYRSEESGQLSAQAVRSG